MKQGPGNPCTSWLPFSRPARVTATKALVGKIELVLMIFWGIIAIIAAIIASMAEPADLPVVFTGAVVSVGGLGLFFAFMVWRRTRSWQRDLPRRLTGMVPAGTAIGVDAAVLQRAGKFSPGRRFPSSRSRCSNLAHGTAHCSPSSASCWRGQMASSCSIRS
jgi:hypothetical protein